jgi:hypothetical protein
LQNAQSYYIVCTRSIALIYRDHEWHVRVARVSNTFDCLLHDTVVGSDNQHDYVGGVCATLTHLCKGGVAGRVEKGDCMRRARQLH